MNIPTYWVRANTEVPHPDGRRLALTAWGWSSSSRAEAEQKAHERLAALATRVQQGADLPKAYGYGSRPLREEIVQEISGDGEAMAIITRNSYGSLVLNTSRAMFIDIDLQQQQSGQAILGRFFGKEKAADPVESRLASIKEALQRSASGSTFRIYRTAAGFRILAIDPLYQPGSPESEQIMKSVGADPSFVQLCRAQQSFRARLTPKPWRCGSMLPPGDHPRERDHDQRDFQRWLHEYDQKCASKATCKFVGEAGFGRIHDSVKNVLEVHDRITRATNGSPLA